MPPWPLATPWWRHVGWETARRREASVPEQKITMSLKAHTGCELAGRRKWLLGGRVFLKLGCARGLSVKKHMCPCKQGRRWSPSSEAAPTQGHHSSLFISACTPSGSKHALTLNTFDIISTIIHCGLWPSCCPVFWNSESKCFIKSN